MIPSQARPPLIALFVAHGTVDDTVAGVIACNQNLVIRQITLANCRRDIERLEVDVIVVDGRMASAIELIHTISTTRPTVPTLYLATRLADVRPAVCAGAHDFVLLNTAPAEVVLRLELLASAMLRPLRKERRVGPLRLDRESRTVSVGTHSVSLSPHEFKMFEQLLLHADRPVSRAELEQAIWGQTDPAERPPTNIAVVYVSYLRRKLAGLGDVCSIRTITNAGYALDVKVPADKPRRRSGRRRAP